MESDKVQTIFFKNIFLLIAILAGLVAIVTWFSSDGVMINDVKRKLQPSEFGLIVSIICIFLPLHILTTNCFVRVKLSGHEIQILDGSELIQTNWNEVQLIRKIPTVVPALYRLRLKNNKKLFLFTTKPVFLQFDLGSVDASEMGELIRERKKQYRL